MDNDNGNTMTVPSPSLFMALRMTPYQDSDILTTESSLEPFEDVKQFLSDKELRRPYRPDEREL